MFWRTITISLTAAFLSCFALTVEGESTLALQTTVSAHSRSIRNWVHCDGKTDDDAGVIAAFAAAKDGAFTLVVDCPVFIHIGSDIRHPIYIDDGTTVQFTGIGQFTVDNVFIPAFVIANSANVHLLGWRVQYIGGIPVDWNTGGYYDNGALIQQQGYDRPAFAFNDRALTPWLMTHRGIRFEGASSPWAGPTDTSAVFFIVGSSNNVEFQNFKIFVPPGTKGGQFIPMVFASQPGYKDNETVTRQTPITQQYLSVPSNFTFSNIVFDGYYMGWQGRFQNTTFQHVRAYRYGDLEDANGGTVGGIGKWFAPPHLFYLNYDPKQIGLENKDIQISDVIDYGQRSGVARDRGGSDKGSGFANSLKIGAIDSTVDGYTSYRPDGLMDVLTSKNLTISNVTATYDSSFLNDVYPAIRFVQPPYQHVTIQNVTVNDKAANTKQLPIWGMNDVSSSQVVVKNVKVNLSNWAKAASPRPMPNLRTAVNVAPSAGAKDFSNLCPHLGGTNNSVDIQFTLPGHTQKCSQP